MFYIILYKVDIFTTWGKTSNANFKLNILWVHSSIKGLKASLHFVVWWVCVLFVHFLSFAIIGILQRYKLPMFWTRNTIKNLLQFTGIKGIFVIYYDNQIQMLLKVFLYASSCTSHIFSQEGKTLDDAF